MRFVYDGDYREFRGHVFAWRKPVTVIDRATIEACLKDPTFKEFKDAVRKEEVPEAPAPEVKGCSKCGVVMNRGLYMHEKYCKGKK